jgi:hypothetical protein
LWTDTNYSAAPGGWRRQLRCRNRRNAGAFAGFSKSLLQSQQGFGTSSKFFSIFIQYFYTIPAGEKSNCETAKNRDEARGHFYWFLLGTVSLIFNS